MKELLFGICQGFSISCDLSNEFDLDHSSSWKVGVWAPMTILKPDNSISSLGCQAVAPPRRIRHRHLITLYLAMGRRKRVSGCVAHCRRVLVAHSAVAELLFCAFEAADMIIPPVTVTVSISYVRDTCKLYVVSGIFRTPLHFTLTCPTTMVKTAGTYTRG